MLTQGGKCIYCDGFQGDSQFSLEHVWPESLGGAFLPSTIFQTKRVCRTCNSRCGQFVDGGFLKSWMIKAEVANSAYRFLDPASPQAVPLFYTGIDTQFPTHPDECCERWLGPAGARVYHIHRKDNERWGAYAGGDPIRRKKADPGRAYVALTSTSQFWSQCALRSFAAYFPKAERYCATRLSGDDLGLPISTLDTPGISDQARSEIRAVLADPTSVMHEIQLDVSFCDRFLCKLALGIGHNVLGPRFAGSKYADRLRRGLWTTDVDARAELGLMGTGFWNGDDKQAAEIGGWPGAWVLSLHAFPSAFGVHLFTPGARNLAMLVSNEPDIWDGHVLRTYGEGAYFVVVPQRRASIGPVKALDFVMHKARRKRHPDLAKIDTWQTREQLPPITRPSESIEIG